jgi:hypothetical protein
MIGCIKMRPLYAQKRTCSSPKSTSAMCHKRTHRLASSYLKKVPTMTAESQSISPEIRVEFARLVPCCVTHHKVTRNRKIKCQTKHAVAQGNFRHRPPEKGRAEQTMGYIPKAMHRKAKGDGRSIKQPNNSTSKLSWSLPY